MNQSWIIPSAVFILAILLQTKISLSRKFLRIFGSMSKTFTHVLSTSRKHTNWFLVKSFAECCGSKVLTACYWTSTHCIPVQKFVSTSEKLNHDRSPLVLDSDKDAFCHRFSRGRIRRDDEFNQTCEIPCKFFSSATFPTVDSSATAFTAACHVNCTISGPPVARQSRISTLGSKCLATPVGG